jgi:hypothetical protein
MRCGILVDRDVPSQVACLRNAKEMCIRESKPTSILEQALALLSLQLPGGPGTEAAAPEAEAAAPGAEEADGEAAGDDALARDEALAGAEDHEENE